MPSRWGRSETARDVKDISDTGFVGRRAHVGSVRAVATWWSSMGPIPSSGRVLDRTDCVVRELIGWLAVAEALG